jgi:hypothetical protein
MASPVHICCASEEKASTGEVESAAVAATAMSVAIVPIR